MKNYSKIHSSKKIAEIHLVKIKKRGGIATMKKVSGGIQIDYHFPEKTGGKPTKKPKTKQKWYDVLSPDGISIRLGDQGFFKSPMEARAYFFKWKKRFEKQGYYSSNYGRISLDGLIHECELKEIE